MANPIIVPPGGFHGWSQQSVAVQALLSPARRKRKKTTRKKRAKTTARRRRKTTAKRKTTRRSKKPAYMVKGSPAAKRRMAQLRKMQKRRR